MEIDLAMETLEQITRAGSYTIATGTVIAGFTLNEWGVLFGIILGLATFLVNVGIKRRMLRLREKEVAHIIGGTHPSSD